MADDAGQKQETEQFLCKWKELEDAVEKKISNLTRETGKPNTENAKLLKEQFENAFTELFVLDRMLSKAAASLPPFVQRKLTTAIKHLRTRAVQAKSERLPRQPFAFSSQESIVLATDPLSQGIRIVGAEREDEAAVQLHDGEVHEDESMGTLSSLSGENRTLDASELQDRAWMISDLDGCTIRLLGTMPALFLHRLSNCSIIAGPVAGATFGEQMKDCSLQLATHQLRLHSCSNVRIHVRAASSPIIEHCVSIGLGPLTKELYSQFEDACAKVHLPSSDYWKDVQDFLHPGSTQTSNWHLING